MTELVTTRLRYHATSPKKIPYLSQGILPRQHLPLEVGLQSQISERISEARCDVTAFIMEHEAVSHVKRGHGVEQVYCGKGMLQSKAKQKSTRL